MNIFLPLLNKMNTSTTVCAFAIFLDNILKFFVLFSLFYIVLLLKKMYFVLWMFRYFYWRKRQKRNTTKSIEHNGSDHGMWENILREVAPRRLIQGRREKEDRRIKSKREKYVMREMRKTMCVCVCAPKCGWFIVEWLENISREH